MKILTLRNLYFILIIFLFVQQKSFAQTGNINVIQDERFEEMLIEKRKINASTTATDRFRIQIYNGDAENAKIILAEFKKNYRNADGSVVFFTPIYKVCVGNFKTRIEAEKNLLDLKKKYPNAFLVKPSR